MVAKQRKIPSRMCLGCREMKPKKQLIRIVRNNENKISIDLTGKKPGRGAYVCKDIQCFEKTRKGRKIDKTFEMAVDNEIYDMLRLQLERNND